MIAPSAEHVAPKRLGLLVPLGGVAGFAISFAAEEIMNKTREMLFEQRVGGVPGPLEMDSICAEGNGIFSIGNPYIIISKPLTRSFLDAVTLGEHKGDIGFVASFQYTDRVAQGGFILNYSGSIGDMRHRFKDLHGASIIESSISKNFENLDFFNYCRSMRSSV